MDGYVNLTHQEKVDNYDKIINTFVAINDRLKVLAKLKGGYKIWVNADNSFAMDTSTVPSFYRWLGGQSRKRIIDIIQSDVEYIETNFKFLEEKPKSVVQINARASLFGIYNLKNMYPEYEQQLDTISQTISKAVDLK